MTIRNFPDHIKMRLLRHGKHYFISNRVVDLQQFEGHWTAIVRGSELYGVKIRCNEQYIEAAFCECFAYSEYDYCKHVVAVLYEIQQRAGILKNGALSKTMVEKMPVIETFYEALARNGDARLIEHGYIALADKNYAKAVPIALSVIATVPPPLPGTRQYKKNTAATNYINKGFELLLRICKTRLPRDTRIELYERALKASLEPRFVLAHYNPHWIDILLQIVEKGNEKQVLRITNELLKQSTNPKKYPPNLLRLLKIKLQVLKKMGRGAEAIQLLKTYKGLSGLRDALIETADELNDRALTKTLGLESLDYYKGYDKTKYSHHRDLNLNLAQKYNDKRWLRQLAYELYKETMNLQYYRLIKNTYTKKQWPAVMKAQFTMPLENKIGPKSATAVSAARELFLIYEEEQLFGQLISLVQRTSHYPIIQSMVAALKKKLAGSRAFQRALKEL